MQSGWPRDPRSPSAEFRRTPIMDEKRLISLADPRSPTVGVPRTPIMAAKKDVVADSAEKANKPNFQKAFGEEASGAIGAPQQAAALGTPPGGPFRKPKGCKPIRRKLFATPEQK